VTTPSRNTDLERYNEHLRELAAMPIRQWAGHLDVMAYSADALALTARMAGVAEEAAKWDDTALLLRTVAGACRGYVLSGPRGDARWLTATAQAWTALVWEIDHGSPADRAETLYALFEAVSPWIAERAATVLDDLAAAELAAARLELAA
jgi:hypothetical protein